MGVSVTENVTTVSATNGTTVAVTENVTSVSVSDSTATINLTPTETSVSISGNTTSVDVTGSGTDINITSDSLGVSGSQRLSKGKLTIVNTKSGANFQFNDPLLSLRTTDSSTGRLLEFRQADSTTQDKNPAMGMLPSASDQTMFIGAATAGLLIRSNPSSGTDHFIYPCTNEGTATNGVLQFGGSTQRLHSIYSASGFFDTGLEIGGHSGDQFADFETGSYQPTVSANSTATRAGSYIRINDYILFEARFAITATAPQALYFTLPFTAEDNSFAYPVVVKTPSGFKFGDIIGNTNSVTVKNDDGTNATMENGSYAIQGKYRI